MPLRLRFLALIVVSIACAPFGLRAHAASSPGVLVLYSNNRLLPANIEVDRGLRAAIATPQAPAAQLYSEFLDTPVFSGERYERAVATYLNEKYGGLPPAVILVAGRPALEFMLRQRAHLFAQTPVVHLAVDREVLQTMGPLPTGIVGVPVDYDFDGTIRQALRWHPAARRLVVVTGASASDRNYEASTRSALARLDGLPPVEFLSALPTAALKDRLARLGGDDVVFTPGYFLDGAGQAFTPRAAATLIAEAAPAPVYGTFSTFMGTGIVGGSMPTYAEMGRQAALAVNSLLGGTPLAQLRLPPQVPAQVHIDWRQARRWGIGEEQLPAHAVVQFREPNFWETYRNMALAVMAVLLLQGLLIAALLLERRQRRRTASALAQSEQRMKLAARAARLTSWVWDTARKGDAAPAPSNPQAVDLGHVLQSVHPADRDAVERAVRRAVEKNEEVDIEYRALRSDGGWLWMAARGGVDQGTKLAGVALDITARKNAELQAERDRAALTHMTRVSTMGQFSASIAHQLNQPLAAILGNAEAARLMLGQAQPDLAELRAICDDIVSEDKRAADIIRRLGALFKRSEMKLAPLDLNELVLESLELVRTELATRQVTPRTLLEVALPPIVGDRIQMQQVLLNLILNAADAMTGIDTASRQLVVLTEWRDEQVRLAVIDRGAGIAPEHLERLFDAFWSTKAGGTGVGLAICKSIVTAHRARITARNNPEGGATFRVDFPPHPHNASR